uniref:Inhibitor I9 domain-containing protein n=1 Tax=Parastrongyloides trichosuri TaxID=131310 RepID=A0A0N4ZTK7_PARTI
MNYYLIFCLVVGLFTFINGYSHNVFDTKRTYNLPRTLQFKTVPENSNDVQGNNNIMSGIYRVSENDFQKLQQMYGNKNNQVYKRLQNALKSQNLMDGLENAQIKKVRYIEVDYTLKGQNLRRSKVITNTNPNSYVSDEKVSNSKVFE